MPPRPLSRWSLATLLIALAAAPIAPARAQAPIKVENVRVGFDDRPAGGRYKLGTWTPVWVDLQAGRERFRGYLNISVLDEDGTPTLVRREIDIPAGQTVHDIATLVHLGSRNAEIRAIPTDSNGRPSGEARLESDLDMVDAGQTIVLQMGNVSGLEMLGNLPKYQEPGNTRSSDLRIVRTRVPERLPGRALGYEALEAVVIDTNDRASMDALAGGGALALKEWVRGGGHLVVAVGQNWQAVNDSPLAEMLPARISGTVRISDPRTIEAFAGNPKSRIAAPPLAARLEDWESRGGIPLAASSSTPIVVRGPFGFGRVTLVGLSVDQAPFASWDDRQLFWDKALDIPGRWTDLSGSRLGVPAGGAIIQRGTSELGGTLHEELEQFPGVRLIPFGWVAFFVFLYILLIGPGDYFFLRKVLKRMELTWITFPLIVLAVSALAYTAAYALKGTTLRLSKSDVVDLDQASGLVRGHTYLSVFSPQNRDYRIGLTPLALDQSGDAPAFEAAPGDPPAVKPGVQLVLRSFGESNPIGTGALPIGLQGYRMLPDGESQSLSGVRIPIWSTKGFAALWGGTSQVQALEVDLVRAGPDRLAGTIKNTLGRPLKDAVLVSGKQVYQLKTIAPGATVRINPNESTSLSAYLERVASRFASEIGRKRPAQAASNVDLRDAVLRVASFHGGYGSRALALANDRVTELDLTPVAVDLRRPTLMATLDGPGSTLSLDWTGGQPQMTQNTLLRVVLPSPGSEPEPQPVRLPSDRPTPAPAAPPADPAAAGSTPPAQP